MSDKDSVIRYLREADAVCFDVDSTVCTGEGIDELAAFCRKEEQVKEMTARAMAGTLDFRDALKQRLNIIQPHHEQVMAMVMHKPLTLTPHIRDLILTLVSLKKRVYLISGGFDCLIHPIASLLEIPKENVFANRLKFYYDGSYAGFDEEQPTSRSRGKSAVIKRLRENIGHSKIVMIGDGVTDLETYPTADAFIGFGGNVVREEVKSQAAWFVTDFLDLIHVLKT